MSINDSLRELREELDIIDDIIVRHLEKRFQISREIIRIKKENGIDVYNPEREKEIYCNILKPARKHAEDSAVHAIFERILDESRRTGIKENTEKRER